MREIGSHQADPGLRKDLEDGWGNDRRCTAQMSRGLIDTSMAVARESGRPLDRTALPDEFMVSVIAIGELRAGILSAGDLETRDRRLETLRWALALHPIVVDDDVATQGARLPLPLRDSGRRMPVNDSSIAATAMALDVPVMTQDTDYPTLPGLSVIRV
jgi:predicted nucleic acid-binding protein